MSLSSVVIGNYITKNGKHPYICRDSWLSNDSIIIQTYATILNKSDELKQLLEEREAILQCLEIVRTAAAECEQARATVARSGTNSERNFEVSRGRQSPTGSCDEFVLVERPKEERQKKWCDANGFTAAFNSCISDLYVCHNLVRFIISLIHINECSYTNWLGCKVLVSFPLETSFCLPIDVLTSCRIDQYVQVEMNTECRRMRLATCLKTSHWWRVIQFHGINDRRSSDGRGLSPSGGIVNIGGQISDEEFQRAK